jgi:hypothetical protein
MNELNEPENSAERMLWTAGPPPTAPTWTGLHDQVMGGRSQGGAQLQTGDGIEPDHVLFSGQISTDNGGGFASYRMRLPAPIAIGLARAVVLTWRGDGGPFKLCLHRQNDWDGVQWQADLSTPGHWITRELPLSAFVARRRGRELRERPLSPDDALFQLGLMTTRPDPGPFWLALARIALS